MNWIPLEPEELDRDGRVELGGERAEHLIKVLRVTAGDEVRALVIGRNRGRARVEVVSKRIVRLRWTADEPPVAPGRVDVLLGMPRPKTARRMWSHLAALGVGRVIVVQAQGSERSYFSSHVLAPATVRRAMVEGLAQSGETRLPEFLVIPSFARALSEMVMPVYAPDARWVADPQYPFLRALQVTDRVLVAIGPERGWSAHELAVFRDHGFHGFGLGPRILRTDAAAIAAIVLVQQALRPGLTA